MRINVGPTSDKFSRDKTGLGLEKHVVFSKDLSMLYLEDFNTRKTRGLGRLELLGTLRPSKSTTVEVMDY